MKKILFSFLAFISFSAIAMPLDSIGVKTVNGKQYIMHKVAKGEGVYGISKKYGVSSNDIYTSNEGADKGIKIGQVLLVPRNGAAVSNSTTAGNTASQTTTVKKTEKKYHTVTSGQTISSIAKKYNLSVAEVKKMNSLKSDNIKLGQKLIVGETVTYVKQPGTKPAEKVPAKVEDTPEIALEEPKKEVKEVKKTEEQSAANVVVNLDKTEADKDNNKPSTNITKSYTVEDGDEVTENGMAIISSEGELNQERSFILHPTAKIGTIIMITNPANNNAVFARVVGSCKTGNGSILKMSKTVADKLGLENDSPVKINYAR